MQLSEQEREVVRICVNELQGVVQEDMTQEESHLRVAIVARILSGFIVKKDN